MGTQATLTGAFPLVRFECSDTASISLSRASAFVSSCWDCESRWAGRGHGSQDVKEERALGRGRGAGRLATEV